MTGNRCVHGMDSRFCAVCNKTSAFGRPRSAIGSVTLAEVLEFLNAERARATDAAVGEVLGVSPRALAGQLGDRGAESGDANVISSGIELMMRLSAWKGSTRKSQA